MMPWPWPPAWLALGAAYVINFAALVIGSGICAWRVWRSVGKRYVVIKIERER